MVSSGCREKILALFTASGDISSLPAATVELVDKMIEAIDSHGGRQADEKIESLSVRCLAAEKRVVQLERELASERRRMRVPSTAKEREREAEAALEKLREAVADNEIATKAVGTVRVYLAEVETLVEVTDAQIERLFHDIFDKVGDGVECALAASWFLRKMIPLLQQPIDPSVQATIDKFGKLDGE
jgi:hypothetical protein